ncbi:peptidase M20 domain-containing protein 2-like [Mytilus edulis]|uniref:peptidase M20 domain-containing protein 2-like n=1 Tax=Mytilus edulis TaxID=6550 RepID=UPI0039F0165D
MENMRQAACLAIDNASEDLNSISQILWKRPELGLNEIHAHTVLTDFLKQKGFTVHRHFILDTAFKAELGSTDNGPNIAVICEYDALPEIGHACGHNLIAESGIAAAIGVQAAFKCSGTPIGKITIMGTPDEEGYGGKIDLIESGAFNNIDVAMMVHPFPKTISNVEMLAVDGVTIKYIGKAAHAAAYPWEGVNALDAAVLCYQNVSCLRQQLKPTWRVHGVIKNGGVKPNIIPELSELEFYFRTPSKKELDKLRDKMKACFEAAAVATCCQVKYEFTGRPCLNVVTNKRLEAAFRGNAESLGVKFESAEGQIGGSTDMGNVSQIVPSIHPFYAIGTSTVNHSKDFALASGDPKAQLPTLTQGKAMALTCLELFQDKDLLKEIKEEFAVFKTLSA